MRTPPRQRMLRVAAVVIVIAAAALVWHKLPTPDDVYGPFDVHAGLQQQAVGRAITAEVGGVRIGPRIRKDRDTAPTLDALGVWVAVDAEAMTTRDDAVANVELLVGPNTYVPTDRLGGMLSSSLAPGIAMRSSWVFDVPADLVAPRSHSMSLRVWVGDGRMDSRLVIDIALDDPLVTRSDLIVIEPEVLTGT